MVRCAAGRANTPASGALQDVSIVILHEHCYSDLTPVLLMGGGHIGHSAQAVAGLGGGKETDPPKPTTTGPSLHMRGFFLVHQKKKEMAKKS